MNALRAVRALVAVAVGHAALCGLGLAGPPAPFGRVDPVVALSYADGFTPGLRQIYAGLASGSAALSPSTVVPQAGARPLLVVLVSFDDVLANPGSVGPPAYAAYPAQSLPVGGLAHAPWRDRVFLQAASMATYYEQASAGAFTLVPARETSTGSFGDGLADDGVVGWIRPTGALQRHPNDPPERLAWPAWSTDLARDVLTQASAYVDFASFDADGDLRVGTDELLILIVVAGFDSSYNEAGVGGTLKAQSPGIWPHAFYFTTGLGSTGPLVLDGVEVATFHGEGVDGSGAYAMVGERQGVASGAGTLDRRQATIGQACHELGHQLFLPDAYDTDGSSQGAGAFDLMAYGSWNTLSEPGDSPSFPAAYERRKLGWTEVLQPTATAWPSLRAADATGRGHQTLVARSTAMPASEYFLVECRQHVGFDQGLPGSAGDGGLLIWHVDESILTNDHEPHYFLDLEEASGVQDLEVKSTLGGNFGDGADYWREGGADRWADYTTPNSRSWYRGATGLMVSGVGPAGSPMSFTLTIAPPAPAGGGGGGGCSVGGLAAPAGPGLLPLLAPLALALARRRRRSPLRPD